MKLFTVGPAQMYEHTIEVRNKTVPYFRTAEFSKVMLENEEMMRIIMDASDDAKMIPLTASGSGAMEATVWNCFDSSDKLLVISGGTFGERFEQICSIHKIPYTAIKLQPNEELEYRHLEAYENAGYTGLLVNLHETYTGQLYDGMMLSDFCKRNDLIFVVDAISTFLCDEYSMKNLGADATIVSSQKGLCLAPGLSIVMLSNRMIERVMRINIESLYFNFKDYLINMKRGQTPFTPAVGVCFELHDMLKYILNQGVENRIKEVKDRCNYFRNKISNLPIKIPSFPLSNAITPCIFEKDIANDFFIYLKDNKDIMVNPVGGELGKRSIRVAHIGDLSFSDYDELIVEIKKYFGM